MGLDGSAEAYNALVAGLERGVFYQASPLLTSRSARADSILVREWYGFSFFGGIRERSRRTLVAALTVFVRTLSIILFASRS